MRTLRPEIRLDLPAHPRFKGFEEFAAREIEPEIAEREGDRRRAVGRAKAIAIGAALVVIALVALALFDEDLFSILIGLAVGALLTGLLTAMKPLTSFNAGLGHFLVRKACAHLGLRHTGEAWFAPFQSFLYAGLVPSYDRRSFEDGVECADPDFRFRLAEAILTDSSDDWVGTDNNDPSVWRGLLLEVAAPRPLAGEILVAPKGTIVPRDVKERLGKPIELSWGGLEADFAIRATDPDEARAIVTEPLMRRLAELAGRLGRHRPALGLAGSNVLLAIEGYQDRFQAGSVFKSIELADQLNPILAEFALVIELAETLRDALAVRVGRAR